MNKFNAVSIEFVNGKDLTFTPYPVHKLLTDFGHKIICKLIRDIRSSALYNSPSQEIMELCDSMTRFYFQSWTNMHLGAQKSSLCDLMLFGTARNSENRNQPAASLKGARDAPNLNQTIDLMLINALLFRTPFSSQKWITTLILFRRLATTTKPYFV